jgi:hypothetical protein
MVTPSFFLILDYLVQFSISKYITTRNLGKKKKPDAGSLIIASRSDSFFNDL